MASLQEHCQDCMRELGERFEHVHLWLDELFERYGPMHRPFRHHTGGVEMVRAKWGDRAARAAEIHIRRDCGGIIATPEQLREHWGVRTKEIEPLGD